MTAREAYLALNLLPLIGPLRAQKLNEVLGSPQAALAASRKDIISIPGMGAEVAEALTNWESRIDLMAELKKIRDRDLTILTWDDDVYPPQLRNAPSPPLVLYVWGRVQPTDLKAIGVVGSRKTSHYGLNQAHKFSSQLAQAGYCIISGLARGIDTAAHEGALSAKGRTIAVIGSGIGKLYPPENMALAERIASSGAVITEFPVDYPPDKKSFPLRNRIVAAWCDGLLVVEAPRRSGALITTAQATEIGKPIFAIPGPIDRPTSGGTNALIQDGAKLVTCTDDIINDLKEGVNALSPQTRPVEKTAELPLEPKISPKLNKNLDLSLDEQKILDELDSIEVQLDEVISRTGLQAAAVSTGLMRLEMKRLVKTLPGKYFVKLV